MASAYMILRITWEWVGGGGQAQVSGMRLMGGSKMIKISVNLHKIVFSLYEHCLYTYGFLAAA